MSKETHGKPWESPAVRAFRTARDSCYPTHQIGKEHDHE